MFDTDPIPDNERAGAEPPSAVERARALIEQQLSMLTRLADMGLNIAAAVEQQALADTDTRNTGLAYARIAKSVRMTIALQTRVLKDLAALEDEAARQGKVRRERTDEVLVARKDRVWRIVERVAVERLTEEDEPERDIELASLRYGTHALLEQDLVGDILERPLGALVETICQGLGLDPDWEALAKEAWAIAEAQTGDPRSPFVRMALQPVAAAP